ncbi:endonuclease [Nocardioides sp.]|uniref:endonuclease n=1 Tax=Nocardioides sp. TaxID=35761 RepID=UPI0019B310B7|nr:endonuclease [Nocardioides sp.]MBC7277125.1 endonuclease [Nocardioides sp.]
MPISASRRLRLTLASLVALALASFMAVVITTAPAQAATINVSTAIASQNGSTATVRGYVVGQPTATNTVVTSNYPSDYALAIADSATETSTSRMLYVQIPTAFRSAWGLRSNPSLKGRQIDVTGTLAAYFSHPGHKNATAFAFAGSTPPPTDPSDPPPTAPGVPPGYYDSASGLSGAQLKSALHNIIDGHTTMSYSAVWEALKVLDQDPNNSANVIEFYSGVSTPKTNNGGGADNWNREHTWPQSRGDFGTSNGPGTDVHHLRPEDVTVNSTRGSKDFDLGGSAVSECGDCWTDSDSFEPRDSVKGDLARGILYMAVRYNGDDGFADLEVNNTINGSTNYLGKVCVLLDWHGADPVTTAERSRNDRIYSTYQRNRNPFVDHPEYADAVFGATC